MGKSSPPPPPDYAAAANATAAGNIEAARLATTANRVNQYTPYGDIVYTNGVGGNPDRWRQDTNLSPAGQQLFDSQMAINSGLSDVAGQGLGYVKDTLNTPFDWSLVPGAPTIDGPEPALSWENYAPNYNPGPNQATRPSPSYTTNAPYKSLYQRTNPGQNMPYAPLATTKSANTFDGTMGPNGFTWNKPATIDWQSNPMYNQPAPAMPAQSTGDSLYERRMGQRGLERLPDGRNVPIGSNPEPISDMSAALRNDNPQLWSYLSGGSGTVPEAQISGYQGNGVFEQPPYVPGTSASQPPVGWVDPGRVTPPNPTFTGERPSHLTPNQINVPDWFRQNTEDWYRANAERTGGNATGGGGFSRPGINTNLTRNQMTNALYERQKKMLDPQFGNERNDLETRLANQGIMPGSEAYNREMDAYNRNKNNAYDLARNSAILGGGQEQSRLFGLGMQSRQQAIQDQSFARSEPLNMLSALRSGTQVNMPTYNNVPQQNATAGPDMLNAALNNYTGQVGVTNARNANANQTAQAAASAAMMAMMF